MLSLLYSGQWLKAGERLRTEPEAAAFLLAEWCIHLCVLGALALPDDSGVELSSVQVYHSERGRGKTFTKARQRSPKSLHVCGGESVGQWVNSHLAEVNCCTYQRHFKDVIKL